MRSMRRTRGRGGPVRLKLRLEPFHARTNDLFIPPYSWRGTQGPSSRMFLVDRPYAARDAAARARRGHGRGRKLAMVRRIRSHGNTAAARIAAPAGAGEPINQWANDRDSALPACSEVQLCLSENTHIHGDNFRKLCCISDA